MAKSKVVRAVVNYVMSTPGTLLYGMNFISFCVRDFDGEFLNCIKTLSTRITRIRDAYLFNSHQNLDSVKAVKSEVLLERGRDRKLVT